MNDTLSFSSNVILEAARQMVPAFHAAPRRARRHVAGLMHEALVVCAILEGVTYDELLSQLESLPEEGRMADSGKQVIPRTVNTHFNNALDVLTTYHPHTELAGLPVLHLAQRPAGLRTDRAWESYLDALFTVQAIGTREGWVKLHQNRRGRGVFMVLDIPADGSSRRRQQTQEATNG